jgi:ferredoxin-thioredoxin reductase catalytic subunit
MSTKSLIEAALERNEKVYGKRFCPCVPKFRYTLPDADDLVCPCKEYRETGHCHCGLYDDRKEN